MQILKLTCIVIFVSISICHEPRVMKIKTPSHEFFTAASDMEILYKVEKKLAKRFLKYYQQEEARLNLLESEIQLVEQALPYKTLKRGKDEEWVSKISNAYKIIQRFSTFWYNISTLSKVTTTGPIMSKLKFDLERLKRAYPSENDLRGSIAAIIRIQDTFDIHPAEFIDGLNSISHKLSVEEIFEFGFLCVGIEDYYHSQKWFKEALYRFPPNTNQIGFLDRVSLTEYLAWSEYHLGNLEDAIKHTKNILKLNPTHNAAKVNLELFEKDLLEYPTGRRTYKQKAPNWETKYDKLCQGVEKMDQKAINQLFCRYENNKARFILKPLKVEHAYNDPNIFIYHDLLSEFEMAHIKKIAYPFLGRATVHHPKTNELVYADYRVSKSTWISPEMDEVVSNMIKRVGDVVGLNMRHSEHLQVANYGLAGQYEPHYDHATFEQPKTFKKYGGNRIATMLMYMSQVERGGSTVFTNTGTGVTIKAEKGSGVFWYNLLKNGKSNSKTQHAGCPVVLGQKWIANLWIHEHGQEFNRPCSLNESE